MFERTFRPYSIQGRFRQVRRRAAHGCQASSRFLTRMRMERRGFEIEIEMTGRPGLFGGPRQGDAFERDAFSGDARDSLSGGFDPVWGTLGAPSASKGDPWLTNT